MGFCNNLVYNDVTSFHTKGKSTHEKNFMVSKRLKSQRLHAFSIGWRSFTYLYF